MKVLKHEQKFNWKGMLKFEGEQQKCLKGPFQENLKGKEKDV
jgi:hypothetical protein